MTIDTYWAVTLLLALQLFAPHAAARMTPCDLTFDCGAGMAHALAGQVRVRELTPQERTQVAASWLATYEYLVSALEFLKAHPGSSRAQLPLPSEQLGVSAAMNSLLAEVNSHGQPRSEWIDQDWAKNRLATHIALLVWRQGVVHPRIPQLALADGYPQAAYETCDSLCRYYRLMAQEPNSMSDKVVFYMGRQDADANAAFVRLAELGSLANDVALQLYQQNWPGVPASMRARYTDQLHFLLIRTGDSRSSQVDPADMSHGSRTVTRATSGVPVGMRSLKKSLAYLVHESQRSLIGAEALRSASQGPQ